MQIYLKNIIFLLLFSISLFASKDINLTRDEKNWIKNNPTITYSEINWKPLSIIENDKMNGIMGDFLNIVSKNTGLIFKFIPSTSWPHVLEQFKQEKIDIVPGIGSSPQERELGLISTMYASYPMVIVTSNKIKYLEGLKELENKIIAVPKYYTSYNFIRKNFPNIKILTTETIPEALLFVEEGKADAFVGHIATSLFYISENLLKNLKITGTTSFKFEHHYLVQKNNPILLSIINKTFNSITYQEKKEIYSRWVQTTVVEKSIDYTITIGMLIFFILLVSFLIYRQKLLKESKQDLLNLLNSSIDGIIVSKNKFCMNANTSASKILKCKKEELLGTDILDLVTDEYKEKVIEAIKNEYSEAYEIEATLFNKEKIPLLIQGKTLVINNEKVRVTSFVDLTEIKQKEALLYQQSKIAAIGEMIGNIAHQWRQPLASISGHLASIKLSIDLEEEISNKEIETCTTRISEQCEYLSTTIDNFRNFFISDSRSVEKVNLADTINKCETLIKDALHTNNIKLIKNFTTCEIKINESTFIQALINIFNNAKDAIILNNIDEDSRFLFIDLKKEENIIVLEITDSAGGIDDKIIDKIFEPYYTTKHKSKGTGIGLYMTNQIITKHLNGTIKASTKIYEYENNTYTGAVFTIKIPII